MMIINKIHISYEINLSWIFSIISKAGHNDIFRDDINKNHVHYEINLS